MCFEQFTPPKKQRLSPTRATAAAEGLQGLRKVSAICGSVKLLDGRWICVLLAILGWFHSDVGIFVTNKRWGKWFILIFDEHVFVQMGGSTTNGAMENGNHDENDLWLSGSSGFPKKFNQKWLFYWKPIFFIQPMESGKYKCILFPDKGPFCW